MRSLPFNSFLTLRCELTRTRKDVWHWLLLCALHRQAMPCSGDVMVWCCNGICILHLPVQSSTLCPGQHETHMFGSFVPLTLVHQMRRPSELAKLGAVSLADHLSPARLRRLGNALCMDAGRLPQVALLSSLYGVTKRYRGWPVSM